MGYAWSWDDVPGLALSERSAIAAGNKTCTRCGTGKPVSMFDRTRRTDGTPRLHPWCKACRSVARKIAD